MKNLSYIPTGLSLILIFMVSVSSLHAQSCAASAVDQELIAQMGPFPPTPTNFISGQYLAQTFTPTQSNVNGALVVVPSSFGPGTFTISLWEGTPNAPVSMLATGNVTIGAGGGPAMVSYSVIPVIPGNPYFIQIESLDFTMGFFATSPLLDEYPGGDMWLNTLFPLTPLDIYFQISYCTSIATIPTLGQWGLILLALLLVNFGTVRVLRQKMVMAGGTLQADSIFELPFVGPLPFNRDSYKKGLVYAFGLMAGIFGIAISGFGYEWMQADYIGIIVTLPVLGYLLHLLSFRKE